MSKKILYLLYIFVMLAVITGCQPASNPTDQISVYGQIKDYNHLTPIDNVQVTAGDKSVYTDYNGYYRINNIKTETGETISWKAEKKNYLPINKEIIVNDEDNYNINTRLQSQRKYSGTISGNVKFSADTQTNTKLSTGGFNSTNHKLHKKKYSPDLDLKPMSVTSYSDNYIENEILVSFKSNMINQKILAKSSHNKSNSVTLSTIFPDSKKKLPGTAIPSKNGKTIKIKGPATMTTEELYDHYKQLEFVEEISLNHIGYPMAKTSNDPLTGYQWSLKNMKMYDAWAVTTGSRSVSVAVIDTGYLEHPDLIENIDHSRDLVDDDYQALDQDSYYNSDSDYLLSHGTHVAGIIGATGNNKIGISGVNWKVDIIPIRIFQYQDGVQYFKEEALIEAINYAIDIEVDVINLSLAMINFESSAENHQLMESVLEEAYNRGITIVAAAGNSYENEVFYPASSDYTIAVGATGPDNELAYYSNHGPGLDILAPGGNTDYCDDNTRAVLSTHGFYNNNDLDYLYMEGTSMAAPQVSGLAALLYSQGISSPAEVKNIIKQTAVPAAELPPGTTAGIVDAAAALYQVTGSHDYSDIRVMAASKKDGDYYVQSEIANVDYRGNFYISNVRTDKPLYLIAWKDINNDEVISDGDYYQEYQSEINLDSGENITGIEINIETYEGKMKNVYY